MRKKNPFETIQNSSLPAKFKLPNPKQQPNLHSYTNAFGFSRQYKMAKRYLDVVYSSLAQEREKAANVLVQLVLQKLSVHLSD